MRDVNAEPPATVDQLLDQIRKVSDVLEATPNEHQHEPLRLALRGLHEATIGGALTAAGINDWWVMHGPGTIHVPYGGNPPKGTVYISDPEGWAPDGTRGYTIGLADPYDGSGEECVLILTNQPITNLDDAINLFIDSIKERRGQAPGENPPRRTT